MHISHLYKILTTDLRPAYYFKFDIDTGKKTMNVMHFHSNGSIYKEEIWPTRYFEQSNRGSTHLKTSFITKRKYRLLMKRLRGEST